MTLHTKRLHPDLPIFLVRSGGRSLVYTPGHAVLLSPEEARCLTSELAKPHEDGASGLASQVRAEGASARLRWQSLFARPFIPECLTVYLSNQCDLGCTYCFASRRDGSRRIPRLSEPSPVTPNHGKLPLLAAQNVEAAARIVAEGCKRAAKRFTLVVHGGGEPTIHWDLLRDVVSRTRGVAVLSGLAWWGYIATNGVLSEERATWLAEHFDLVGLSCDGPPDIHDRQRPTRNGHATSEKVKRTAHVFLAKRVPFVIRATITPWVVHRQAEIVAYSCRELGATDIRFEPVYSPRGRRRGGFRKENAHTFIRHYAQAQEAARSLGVRLTLSGARTDEIHGPYCNVLRNVLQLPADGAPTACFLVTDSRLPRGKIMRIGDISPIPTNSFTVDLDRISQIRERLAAIPTRCEACVNIHHCARDCPEVCPVFEEEGEDGGFRCELHKRLTETWLSEVLRLSSQASAYC